MKVVIKSNHNNNVVMEMLPTGCELPETRSEDSESGVH